MLFKVLHYLLLEPLSKEPFHVMLPKVYYQYFVEAKDTHRSIQA